MRNILRIQGGGPGLAVNPDNDLNLSAHYKDAQYGFSKVTGLPGSMILHFSSDADSFVPDALNIILLMTNNQGVYRATGLSQYDKGDGKPQFFLMGDDLEIRVDGLADMNIRTLPRNLPRALIRV